ncbi:porin family protein [Yeosuana sp. MJ-SS3]|uniref:Porin family protein n=1 Tax=Gilvirhabdus luticola TaxID=3079858 RepID=A0ABU3U8F0_9FLAO|nr:porin family protein [Yeosuana sp. MJ-SS3]MDU8886690.1 porin family protein [Yeosuana sp. MJ-SS3]
MRNLLYTIIFIITCQPIVSQVETEEIVVDSLYKEDQFYVGITYNLLGNKPEGINQSGFSSGFHIGTIKDMPINKKRNVAIGIGIGYSGSSYNQNMLINKNETGHFTYTNLRDIDAEYTKNKFATHMVEFPIEFRWRTSTPSEYKFWRIYTGFKLGYVFANTSKFKGDLETLTFKNNKDFNDFQYGLTCSLGYNTWNLFFYYALNPIFSSDAKIDDVSIDMSAIKIGLMFYIL